MNICLLTPYWINITGGITRVVSELSSELANIEGNNVCVIAPNANIYDYSDISNRTQCVYSSVYKALRQCSPDVVHVHGSIKLLLIAWIIKQFSNYRLVYTFHTQPRFRNYYSDSSKIKNGKKYFAKFILSKCDYITGVSLSVLTNWEAIYNRKFQKMKVIYNGTSLVETKNHVGIEDGNAFKFDNSYINILTVGVFAWDWKVKGIEESILAMSRVVDRRSDIRLYVVGGEPNGSTSGYKKFLVSLIEEHNLQNNVVLVGNVSDIVTFYQNCDFYIHMASNEACPMSILEAMSYGLACVAVRKGGISEIIYDVDTGLLVDDVESMADKILLLASDKKLRSRLGLNAAKYAHINHNWGKIANDYCQLYKGVVD